MARTRQEIYDQLVAEKERVSELAVLQDTLTIKEALKDMSEVSLDLPTSLERLWLYIVSFGIFVHEQIFVLHKAEVEEIVSSADVHTSDWYAEKVLLYQHGDPLLLHPESKQPYYEVVDESKQIVKNVAVAGKGFALIKCKGADGALSEDQRLGVESFVREIQGPGAQVSVIASNSDKLRVHADLHYNAAYDRQTVIDNVEKTISDFIQNLKFNGELLRSDMVFKAREVPGATDFYIRVLMARSDDGVYAEVEDRYYSTSGWLELEDYKITAISDV